MGVKGSNNHTPCSSTVAYFALFYRNELILQSFLQNEVVKCSLNDLSQLLTDRSPYCPERSHDKVQALSNDSMARNHFGRVAIKTFEDSPVDGLFCLANP